MCYHVQGSHLHRMAIAIHGGLRYFVECGKSCDGAFIIIFQPMLISS